jgi:hypothetical protein
MPKLYEEGPSAILYKQLHPRIASLYKTFGDEAWSQQNYLRQRASSPSVFFYRGFFAWHSAKSFFAECPK